MATKKPVAKKTEAKPRVRWPFPRATSEQALNIPTVIKQLHGGNPWEPEEVRKTIGAGTGGNAFFYLTAASRDYGLTTGTNSAEKIGLADLGRDLAYSPDSQSEQRLKLQTFLNINVFKRVLDYYKGSNLPEMRYLGNTLQKEFDLQSETHEKFSRLFRENCQYLGITSGAPQLEPDSTATSSVHPAPGTVTLAEASETSKFKAFVVMPFVERDPKHSPGFFAEVLRTYSGRPCPTLQRWLQEKIMGLVSKDDGWRLPDELWQQMEPLLPARPAHPLGCHNPRVADRSAMNAILLVLRTGMQWNALNATGVCTSSSAYRRFREWCDAGDVFGVLAARAAGL